MPAMTPATAAPFALASLALLGLLVGPPAAAHQTDTGSVAAGEVDTYGILLREPDPDNLIMVCPADIYFFTITLRLLDPTPGDVVGLAEGGDFPALDAPADVATYDDPVATIRVQLGGCNRETFVAVVGVLVEGSVDYEITY